MEGKDWYDDIPKVELHRHLECTVRLETIAEVAKHHNLPLPHKNLAELRARTQILTPLEDLKTVIDVFMATQSILVAPEVLERIAFEAVEDAWYDGIRLLELRYAPSFAVFGHQLTYEDAFDAFTRGLERARAKYPLPVGLIGIIVREHGAETAAAVARHFIKHRTSFVGVDLAGIEANFDFASLATVFRDLRTAGFPLTIHAGEEKGLAKNVSAAIESYGAVRIGHGVQSAYDEEVFAKVRDTGTVLELCPTSNWLTRAVAAKEQHPLPFLLRRGAKVTINSDDPGVFGIRLSGEYRLCGEVLGLTRDEIAASVRTGLEASFIDPDQKAFYGKKYFGARD